MSRRGAGNAKSLPAPVDAPVVVERRKHIQLIETPALGRELVATVKGMLRQGLTAAEVCSLLTQTAAALAQSKGGLDRDEWFALCAELYDRQADDLTITSKGGAA